MVRLITYSKKQISITSTAPLPLPTAHARRNPTSSSSVSQSVLCPTSVKSYIMLMHRGTAIKTSL